MLKPPIVHATDTLISLVLSLVVSKITLGRLFQLSIIRPGTESNYTCALVTDVSQTAYELTRTSYSGLITMSLLWGASWYNFRVKLGLGFCYVFVPLQLYLYSAALY